MPAKNLNKSYIQKSRLFLYPLLGIKRGVSVTPIEVYTSWEGRYCFTDARLLCRYHDRDDPDFKIFDEVKLSGNTLFQEKHELEDGTLVYVFDLSKYHKDFWRVITGQYSELSKATKKQILKFFEGNTNHYVYIKSYLQPADYYEMYRDILGCDLDALKHAVELCSKPDLNKELLELSVKVMHNENNPVNLQP